MVPVEDCVSLAVYSFTFLLGLPSNLLVLFVYIRKARKHGATPSVVYALNLCVANLALVAWMPVKTMETALQAWALPAAVCPIYSFFLFSSLYGSCLFLTAVTVGRYLSIAFPITYKLYRRARLSCFISAALWALVLLHLGLGLVVEQGGYFVSVVAGGNGDGDNNGSDGSSNGSVSGMSMACFENFTASQLELLLPLRLEMALLLFLVPLLITGFCTMRCVALVGRSCLPPGGKRRVLDITFSTLAVFVVCYAPYNASHVVGFVLRESVSWRREAMLTSSCNVFLEPLVMLMLSPAGPRGLCACLRDEVRGGGGGGAGGGTQRSAHEVHVCTTEPQAEETTNDEARKRGTGDMHRDHRGRNSQRQGLCTCPEDEEVRGSRDGVTQQGAHEAIKATEPPTPTDMMGDETSKSEIRKQGAGGAGRSDCSRERLSQHQGRCACLRDEKVRGGGGVAGGVTRWRTHKLNIYSIETPSS